MTKIELRPYQQAAIESARKAIVEGRRRVLIIAPTGSGKSILAGKIAALAASKSRVLVLCSQSHLIKQNLDKFCAFSDIDAGIYCAQLGRKDTTNRVIFASRDSLGRKPDVCGSFDGIILDECFPPDVEILTNKGFIRFDQLTGDEVVAQVKKDTLEISFCKPIKFIKKWAENTKLVTLKSAKKIDISMTENHEVVFFKENNSEILKEPVKYIKTKNRGMFRAGYLPSDKNSLLTPIEKLMIAYQADGSKHSTSRAYFTFAKQRKIDDFMALMQEGNFEFKEISCGKPRTSNCSPRRRFSVTMKHKTKFLDEFFDIEKLTLEKAHEIIEYMVKWDGSKYSDNLYIFSSTEKRNSDFYQAIACMCGYSSFQSKQDDNRSEKFNTTYKLFIKKRTNKIKLQNVTKTTSDYTGYLHCVRVEHGNIIVRKNGKPLIIGNCHQLDTHEDSMYMRIMSAQEKAWVVGMTGTPWRLSGGRIWGKGKFFEMVCYNISMTVLRQEGFLVPYRFPPVNTKIDTEGIKKTNGDFNIKQLECASSNEGIISGSVQEWLEYAPQMRCTMFFCVTRNHAQKVVLELSKHLAEDQIIYVDGDTKDREQIFAKIRMGQIKAVVSIGTLTTGFDAPIVDCIVMLRATQSTSLFVQISGRGLRPYEGKKDLLILDFADNFKRFGTLENPMVSSVGLQEKKLSEVESQGEKKDCPACAAEISVFARECGFCGEIFKLNHSNKAHRLGEVILPVRMQVVSVSRQPHIKRDSGEKGFCFVWNVIVNKRPRTFKEYFLLGRSGAERRYRERLAQIKAKIVYVTATTNKIFINPIEVETVGAVIHI